MRKIIPPIIMTCALAISPLAASAQTEKSISLGEAVIKAERIARQTDGWLIYPTEIQKTTSHTGYALLQKLALPNIRIHETEHSVSAIDQRGQVQLRINGIIASEAEMLSLIPTEIKGIKFIDNPGLRYGTEVSYVIDITTNQVESGYVIGTDLSHALTTKDGNALVYGKWNTQKNEWAVSYQSNYSQPQNDRTEETAHYHLTDGSIYTIVRKDLASQMRTHGHAVKLTYNYLDADNTVLQAALTGNFNRTPEHWKQKHITDHTNASTASSQYKSYSNSPVLDLYFYKKLAHRQSLTVNAVGTFIQSSSSTHDDEGETYHYDANGKTFSLLSEAIYEKKTKPLTFSAGLNYKQKYTRNAYTGNTAALNHIHQNHLYLFSEVKGQWKGLHYSGGCGVSYHHNSQAEHQFDHWTFCSKATLMYGLTQEWQMSYTFSCKDRMSRLAMIGDATIRQNPMEWTVGSPHLQPSKDIENSFRISYNTSRFQSFADIYYKTCHHPNMDKYQRTDDNLFLYTQTNQKQVSCLNAMLYGNYWIIPQKLSLMVYGGLFRCFNYGDNYTHCRTSYFMGSSLDAYLSNWTLSAYYDNGSRFLEGEHKGNNNGYTAFKAAYQYKDWQFSIVYQQPCHHHFKQYENEILNVDLQKHIVRYNQSDANYIGLNIAWRFTKGRKYKAIQRSIQLKDTETGIM